MIGGLITAGYNYWVLSNTITTVDVKNLPNATDPTALCMAQIKSLGRTPLKLDLNKKIKFLDVYENQTKKLLSSIEENEGIYNFLVEGASKQGKSTFGQNLHNIYISKNPQNFALYIELDPKDPENLFKKLNKCDWTNFEMALDLLQNNTNTTILMIVDDIQHAFKTKEIASGLLGRFKNMKTSQLNFLYISSQNSVISKMK